MKSKKILISGGNGEFAKELKKHNTNYEITAPSKKEMDVTDVNSLDYKIFSTQPDYFIHAGALTRPMSTHREKPELSIQTNIIGTSNVVLTCMKYNIKLIYLSTDYVYPGVDGNYSEESYLQPVNKYAWSKLGGECSVRLYDNHLILRMAVNKKPFPHPKALVDMKKSLMYIDDASKVVLELLDEKGTINIGGKSQSVYDFVKESNPSVGKIYLDNINDVSMAKDCSMNVSKMKRLLSDSVI
jgi:dTDP-4-dehydrorhamnose reductase